MRIPKNSRHGCKNRIKLELLRIWRLMNGMSQNKNEPTRSGNVPPQNNIFSALDGLTNLPEAPAALVPLKTSQRGEKNTKRGCVDIIRQTAHRGGKGVTIAKNFIGISLAEKHELAKKIQKACGVGGTVKDGCIEIQGDKRDEVKRILTEAGFNPVFSGG